MQIDDRKLDVAIGSLLRAGVLLAVAVVLAGSVAYLARHGTSAPDYRVFTGAPKDLRSVAGVVHGAFHPDGGYSPLAPGTGAFWASTAVPVIEPVVTPWA